MPRRANPRPTHRLTMKPKEGGHACVIGVAWLAGSGFSIRLNPGTVISHRDQEDYFFGLFPVDDYKPGASKRSEEPPTPPTDGDINF